MKSVESISTKNNILKQSLELFSKIGYDGVSMRDIAAACGIKASSIYEYYKGKDDILNCIIKKIDEQYLDFTKQLAVSGVEPSADAEVYMNITKEQLCQIGKNMFLFFIHDDFTSKIRKLATIEQFRNPRFAKYLQKQYMEDAMKYQSTLFGLLMEKDVFRKADPNTVALQFFSPIYLLMCAYDREPKNKKEILSLLDDHIRQFAELYAINPSAR